MPDIDQLPKAPPPAPVDQGDDEEKQQQQAIAPAALLAASEAPTFLGDGQLFAWRPSDSTLPPGPSPRGRPYTSLKMDTNQLSLDNLVPNGSAPLKVGAVVIFGGQTGDANHAAMLVGFDSKSGTPIWVSDAIQARATVNAATRNGDYVVYQPPAGFDGEKAAREVIALAREQTNGSRQVLGSKSATEFTGYCWQHVSMALKDAGLDIRAGNANQAGSGLLAHKFRAVMRGNNGTRLDALLTTRTGPPTGMG